MTRLLPALLLSAAVSLTLSAQPAGLPSEALGVFEAPKLQALTTSIDAFSKTVTGGDNAAAAPIGALIMGITHSTNSGLIDADKPFRVYLLKGPDGAVAAVAVFAVKGPSAFRNSLRGDLKKAEEKEGLTTYTKTVRSFDRKAYRAATPEERKDMQRFRTAREETVAVGETESAMCVGANVDAVRAMMALSAEGRLPEAPLFPDCDLGLWLNTRAMIAHAAADGKFLNSWREAVKEIPGGAANRVITLALEEYINAIETLGRQVDGLTAKASVTATDLRARAEMTVTPKSALANYLASMPKGALETLKYAPEDSAVVFAGKLGDLRPLIDWVAGVIRRVAATSSAKTELDAWTDKMRQAAAGYGDEAMMAMRPKLPLAALTATRMKDAAAARGEIERMVEMMAPVSALYQGGGITMKIEDAAPKTEIGSAPVWQRKYTLGMAPAGEDPAKNAVATAMETLYGKTMLLTSTVIGRDAVNVISPDSLDTVKTLLGSAHKSVLSQPEFRQALTRSDAGAQALLYVRFTDFMTLAMDIARAMERGGRKDAQAGPGVPQVTFARGPGILLTMRATPAGGTGEFLLPAAELKSVYDGLTSATRGGAPAPKAPPKPAPAPAKPQPPK
jgi:hypothetical protein